MKIDDFTEPEYAAACPIILRIGDKSIAMGTATYVCPGIFLTAKHIIEYWFDEIFRTRGFTFDENHLPPDELFDVDVFHILKDGAVFTWQVNSYYVIPNNDVAILSCEYAVDKRHLNIIESNYDARTLITGSFSLHPPVVGQTVVSLGYPGQTTINLNDDKPHIIRLNKVIGQLEDVHMDGIGLVKSSALQTDLKLFGGMSGGPILDEDSYIIGINSSGIDVTDESITPVSFGSMLLEIFSLPIYVAGHGVIALYELGQKNCFSLKGAAHIEQKHDGSISWSSYADKCEDCKAE